ncbi:MAG TPA: hypothetical protein VEB60_01120 [Candidatus Paceibacterota bacterium]|nr:hypothetical protein [Candidatus Paceibacterota bacterium]
MAGRQADKNSVKARLSREIQIGTLIVLILIALDQIGQFVQ